MDQKSILIVEDEQIAAMDLKETLKSLGYRVAGIAGSGERAVEMVDEQVPDLILMDINLGAGMNGIDAAKKILSRHSAPIIYVTAYADPELVDRAKETRPYGYLIKPYDERSLSTEIEIALHKFGLDQNFRQEYETLAGWVKARTEELAKANEEIKASEKKFREIFNSANDAIHLHEIDDRGLPGSFVDVNDVTCRMLGYSKDELLLMNPLELTTEFHSRPLDQIGTELRQYGTAVFETEQRTKDGRTIPVEINAHVVEIGGKKIVVSIIRDITERKKYLDEVVRARDEWEKTFDAVPDLIAIIDEHHRIRRVNRSMAAAVGLLPEQAVGRHCYELVHHTTTPLAICPHSQLLLDGKSHAMDIHEDNLQGDFQLSVSPLSGPDGQVIGSIHILHDITRRKQDEEALRSLSRELQIIIDNAPAMIWYKDTKNTFVRVNPAGAAAFGRPVEEIVGKNARDLFPDLADQYYRDDLDVIQSGKPKLGIIEQMTSSRGGTIWVESDKVPILDEKGAVTGILVFVVDITERKVTQDALFLANKKLGLMASITRHDILNQIMALNAYIELCREEPSLPPDVAGHIRKMAKISSSIERHIAFTRDYQTIGVNAPVWQDVGGCVFRATTQLPMRNVRVTSDLHEVKVLADPLFEKIFYNLIDNALRYGGDRLTSIQISSDETPQSLTLVVEDNGNGIAPEDRVHLFTKGFGKNTGLGLFLSREILSITNMEIRETGTYGKGARFEIIVPKGSYRMTA